MLNSLNLSWRAFVHALAGASVMVILLTSCASAPEQDAQEQAQKVDEVDVAAVTEELAERQRARREQRQARVESILAAADEALADNRLTLPEHDNAYDRYSAVLLLDPGNRRAEAGLQSILLSYVELIRSALRNHQISRAKALLNQAQQYYGGNRLLAEMQEAVVRAEQQNQRRLQQLNAQELEGTEFELPAEALRRRSDEVVEFLAKVAERVRETNESVLIKARSDAEGRWIYKQINDALPGYRLRGDIRVGAPPKLTLLPPL